MQTTPDTRALIDTLVDNLSSVRRLRPPWVRFARSLVAAALLAAVGATLLGTRLAWWPIAGEPELAAHLGIELATGVLAALAAFLLSVPAAPRTAAVRWVPVGVGAAWIVLLAAEVAWGGQSLTGITAQGAGLCLNSVVAVAALPTILLMCMILRAAPLHPAWSGGLATAGAGGLGAFGVHLHCLNAEPMHALVSHVIPILALGLVGALGGAFWHRAASTRLRRQARR